jgi:methionyl-tRNA synthetase
MLHSLAQCRLRATFPAALRQALPPTHALRPRLLAARAASSTASSVASATPDSTAGCLVSPGGSEPASLPPALFTTPIFYPSAVPHVGHLHSLVLTDVLARYARLRAPGRPVLMSTGTDEHGLKIQQAARKAGLAEPAFVESLSGRFRQLADDAGVDYTTFIRTSEPRHHAAVADFWNDLMAKGLIYKGSHEGWYAISDECFYPANQVHDVPSPTEPGTTIKVSIETGSAVEWTAEENYKFRMSEFRQRLIDWLESDPHAITPPKYAASVLADLRAGPLDDLSISRPAARLTWGVPVPGDASHTVYVWFDALVNYLTVLGYPSSTTPAAAANPPPGWPAELQVVGKDIVRFHAIYWPAMLMARGFEPPRRLLVHAHWTMRKMKMSKSTGNVADPNEALRRASVESVRAYLMGIGSDLRDDAGQCNCP